MPGVARIGDMTIGLITLPHFPAPVPWIGFHVSGAPTCLIEGMPAVRIGDIGIFTCAALPGVPFVHIAIGGSVMSLISGMGAHRMGDTVIGPAALGTTVTSAVLSQTI